MSGWRLMIWDVPESLTALLTRLHFTQTRKNPRNWYRIFEATDAAREVATVCRHHLLAAGLKGSWKRIAQRSPAPPKAPHHSGGFGGALNARPTAGTWRRKARRR